MYRHSLIARFAVWMLSGILVASAAFAQQPTGNPAEDAAGGPIRLRQPLVLDESPGLGAPRTSAAGADTTDRRQRPLGSRTDPFDAPEQVLLPSAFEEHVRRLAARPDIRRFGADLMARDVDRASGQDISPQVPDDYLLQPGDELMLNLWGSVDGDLRLVIDRTGRIHIPRVGTVMLAGVRFSDVSATIERRVAQVFKNFQLSVSLGRLRGLRVFMTGYVHQPGPLSVSSLSSVLTALTRAGGPTAAGSLRNIELRRGGQVLAQFDLYDLLLRGDRRGDRLLQADDTIHVGPVGDQVAIIGGVNQPGIFELKSNETVADLLRMAGGFAPVADRSRLSMERVEERSTNRVTELKLPEQATARLVSGDVLRALTVVDLQVPVQLKHKRVRVEGEVTRPGEYVLPANSTLQDGLAAAGGLTASAYVYATDFSRISVRQTQLENYERALRDLETEITRLNSTRRTSSAEEAAAQATRSTTSERLVTQLRQVRPTGRIVLELAPGATELPAVLLEDGDRIYVPPRSATVGVFGSVFNAGSYLYSDGRQVQDYLRLAGGPTKGADIDSAIVVRANGSVTSGRARKGWLAGGQALDGIQAEAGDTIFIPEELEKTTWMQSAKDWTQLIYNLGLGAAAIKAVFN